MRDLQRFAENLCCLIPLSFADTHRLWHRYPWRYPNRFYRTYRDTQSRRPAIRGLAEYDSRRFCNVFHLTGGSPSDNIVDSTSRPSRCGQGDVGSPSSSHSFSSSGLLRCLFFAFFLAPPCLGKLMFQRLRFRRLELLLVAALLLLLLLLLAMGAVERRL